MKVTHLNTYDRGGTGRAVARLSNGLNSIGEDSSIIVQIKSTDDPCVIGPSKTIQKGFGYLRPSIDRLPVMLLGGKKNYRFNVQWLPNYWVPRLLDRMSPDIINLHWVGEGFLNIKLMSKLKTPLVWTLHDVWPFTGGCNVNLDCYKFKSGCNQCPLLPEKSLIDIAKTISRQKIEHWKNTNVTYVAPSHWIAEAAKSSRIANGNRVEVIPNGLDLKVFKPINKNEARDILNLPQDKLLVLFGALNPLVETWKGFEYLSPALIALQKLKKIGAIELVLFGNKENESINSDYVIHNIGKLSDDFSLCLLYSAANVVLMPSVQESFGQVASESFACGTPVVAFDTTGLKDIVDHKENGYLANPFDAEDLANGIAWVLETEDRQLMLGRNARIKAELNFSQKLQAYNYSQLYSELIG